MFENDGEDTRVGFAEMRGSGHRAGPGTILAVDDDPLVLRGLKCVLECWGYVVLAAAGEDEALALVARTQSSPGMILTDYRLRDGLTGAQAVRSIRRMLGHDVPAVIITGDTEP